MSDLLAFLPHASPLIEGRLVQRYDRFIADVELGDGEVVHTHCINPGRMEGWVRPGARVWISRAPEGRKRKLLYTWELMELDGRIVGVNTTVPNSIVKAVLEARTLRGLSRWRELQAERKFGQGSRIDFWLRTGRRQHFLEVKNCHLVYPDGRGYFPDSVSDRASRHLDELLEVVAQGHQATVLFTVQDETAKAIRPSDAHDPKFAEKVRRAAESGVRFRAVRVLPTLEGYEVQCAIAVDVKPYRFERHLVWKRERDATSGWKRRGKLAEPTPAPGPAEPNEQ